MLADTLNALLPGAREAALLRACLRTGNGAREGWQQWQPPRGTPVEVACAQLAELRTLLPLLARSIARHGITVEPGVQAYVRAATLREELRATRYRALAAEALNALQRAGNTVWVVRGAALAATVYDDWSLRHCHDLDLLVPAAEQDEAMRALAAAGYSPAIGTARPGGTVIAEHASGLQVALHASPFAVPFYSGSLASFTGASRAAAVADVAVVTPSPEAMLVHVLGHASYSSSRRNLRWVADAWQLVTRHADLDWENVLARVAEHRLALPVAVLLNYLAGLGLAVPSPVLAQASEGAAAAGRVAEDVALGGITAAVQGDVARMWRSTTTWRGRLRVARWAVAPTPAYVRGAFSTSTTWLIPLCYLYRPVRFVAGRLVRRADPTDELRPSAA